jgi:hypothetical protein
MIAIRLERPATLSNELRCSTVNIGRIKRNVKKKAHKDARIIKSVSMNRNSITIFSLPLLLEYFFILYMAGYMPYAIEI